MAAPTKIDLGALEYVPEPCVSGIKKGVDGNAELSRIVLDSCGNGNFIDSHTIRAARLHTQGIVPFPVSGFGAGQSMINKSVTFALSIGSVERNVTAFLLDNFQDECCLLISATAMHEFSLSIDFRTNPVTVKQHARDHDDDDDYKDVHTVDEEEEPFVQWFGIGSLPSISFARSDRSGS